MVSDGPAQDPPRDAVEHLVAVHVVPEETVAVRIQFVFFSGAAPLLGFEFGFDLEHFADGDGVVLI